MSKSVEPIRDKKTIENMKKTLKGNITHGERDYMLFLVGINIGRRIGDILTIKAGDIRAARFNKREQKTNKRINLAINPAAYSEIAEYIKDMEDDEYVFPSQKVGGNFPKDCKGHTPIRRETAYRILSEAGEKNGLSSIGTHSMRKTFGYHYYQETHDIATLQILFNHGSQVVTLRYIGITQDILDNSIRAFSL